MDFMNFNKASVQFEKIATTLKELEEMDLPKNVKENVLGMIELTESSVKEMRVEVTNSQ
jgi:hypothetical protein